MNAAKPIVAAVIAFLASHSTPALAEGEAKAVVELFTSQGCNSCPPADALLDRLADRDDVIALSYHIDYWDYLGWKDTLGSPAHTERQRAYARSFGGRSVYTPQAIVNGRDHMNGSSQRKVEAAINQMSVGEQELFVAVTMRREGDTMVIEASDASAGRPAKAEILVVYFTPVTSVAVERGENAGKTITYRNAVSSIQAAGMWKGKAGRWEIPMAEVGRQGGGGAAVILQSMKAGIPGPILGAAMLGR